MKSKEGTVRIFPKDWCVRFKKYCIECVELKFYRENHAKFEFFQENWCEDWEKIYLKLGELWEIVQKSVCVGCVEYKAMERSNFFP